MKKSDSIIVIMANSELREVIISELEAQKYKVLLATNSSEARLKFENSENNFMVIEDGISGLNTYEFINNVRRKEKNKNVSIKNSLPILLIGDDAMEYNSRYKEFDQLVFLERPFTTLEFKKKILTFTGNSNAINENTRLVKKGEYLINEGAVSSEMYWVLSGHFIITKMNQDDQNVIIGNIFPGELVGEMSFLDSLPRSASVKAEEDSEVLAIPHKKFVDVFDSQPGWFRSLMKTLSKRLRSANKIMAQKQVALDTGPDHGEEQKELWADEEKVNGF